MSKYSALPVICGTGKIFSWPCRHYNGAIFMLTWKAIQHSMNTCLHCTAALNCGTETCPICNQPHSVRAGNSNSRDVSVVASPPSFSRPPPERPGELTRIKAYWFAYYPDNVGVFKILNSSTTIATNNSEWVVQELNSQLQTWISLRVSSPGRSGGGREKEGGLATTDTSLEFEYLHRKRGCQMLIGAGDICNDVITPGT